MQLPRPPVWLCLAVLIPRLLFLIPAFSAPERFVQADAQAYWRLGHNLWSHGVFSLSSNAPWVPETKYVPGYPLFVGLWSTYLRLPIPWIVFVQLVLNIFTLYLFWAWLNTVSTPARASLATLAFGLDIVTLSYAPILITENLFLFFEMVSLIQTWRCLQKSSWPAWALCGALWGLVSLVRPISIFFPALLFVFFILLKKQLWVFLLAAYLFPGLWCIRNYTITDHWSFSSQGGVDFLMYTAADIEAVRAHKTLDEMDAQLISEIDASHPTGYASESERSTVYGRRAVKIMARHPLLLFRHAAIGACRLLAGTGFEVPLQLWGLPAPYLGVSTISEPKGKGTLALLKRYPWLIPFQLIYWAALIALYVFFMKGVSALWKSGLKAEALLLLGGIFYFIAIPSIHVGYYRFRIPVMPFLLVGAGIALPYPKRSV